MKALIIGGGIAGLATAITLRKAGWNVSVQERAPEFTEVGLGFIILPNGLEALDQVGAGDHVRSHGKVINKAVIRTPDGEIIKDDILDNCLGIKRSSVINSLRELLPAELITNGAEFSHFEYGDKGQAIAAHFTDGRREEADIFVATDGANSMIRSLLFPSHITGSTKIKELVAITDLPELAQSLGNKFLKTQSLTEGLSIGLVPCNNTQVVWYMQFDCMKNDITELTNENKKAFAQKLLKDWPEPIQHVLENTDFSRSFMWFTKDMAVLPAFHKNNIVLAGDAAHLVLPFTSQGVNSALQDAIILGKLLKNVHNDSELEDAFDTYHQCRKEILEEYHLFGKMMANRFLDPLHYKNEDVPLPLAK